MRPAYAYKIVMSHLYSQPPKDFEAALLKEIGLGEVRLNEEGNYLVIGYGDNVHDAKENAYLVALEVGMVFLRKRFKWLLGKYKVDQPKWFIELEHGFVPGEKSFCFV